MNHKLDGKSCKNCWGKGVCGCVHVKNPISDKNSIQKHYLQCMQSEHKTPYKCIQQDSEIKKTKGFKEEYDKSLNLTAELIIS